MPIYEYRCESCQHTFEQLQKMNEAPPANCPQCGQNTVKKLISAAGFSLKGSGWYATDFKKETSPKTTTPEKNSENTCSHASQCAHRSSSNS